MASAEEIIRTAVSTKEDLIALLARAEELLRDRDRVLNDLIKSSVFTEEECKNLDLVKLPESHEFLKRIESLVNKFTNTVEIPVDNRYYYESALPNVQNPKNQAPPPKNVDNDLKLLFVDVDGTLTETLSGSPFKQSPDDIKPIEGAQRAIAHYEDKGFIMFGISNQGGCDTINRSTGKPFKTIESAIAEMQNTLEFFPQINSIYFCPSMSGRYCIRTVKETSFKIYNDFWEGLYRKPDIGMVNEILFLYRKSEVKPEKCLFVGDRDEDKQCAHNVNIPFMPAQDWWR